LGLLVPIGMDISGKSLLTGLAGGMLASWMAGWMRSREELALIGVAVSAIQGLAYLLGKVALSAIGTDSVWNWYDVALQAGLFSLAGIVWSAIAIGISPYLEHFFDLVTPIRLAELANPNRPLLKRLATEAPGTFQHTLFVSTLAEAAARVLGCNVELVRAGTLYHDIGKLHDPLAFIENQMGGANKHDEINDPWESAAIIRKHVTEGLVMARKCRLPMAIQAFIPEHQGTMAIAYFYHQAQQIARQDHSITVDERDFCYAGPAPQSRETALVMLADSCEAALRTLPAAGKSGAKEPTREEALAMVQKILRSRWQDNQLVDSGLTRADMDAIAETFVNIWQQFHHKRIAYPKKRD
ncbi:MAG: HD family phosphohydrolase, partial [Chroococcidiopsis sp.]